MSRRHIVALVLFLAGVAALAVLHHRGVTTEVTPRPLLYLVADAQREAERLPLALTRVSDDEENRIGEELTRTMPGSMGRNPDAEFQRIEKYLNEVGARVAQNVNRKAIRYHFHYQPASYFVNAYAMPGGQIVFGRGLLALLESEDELASILGHEIAHVDQRHAIERLQYQLQSRKLGLEGLYRLGSLGVMIFQAGYTKEQELEADRVGLGLAVAAGYSPGGAIDAMKRLAALRTASNRTASSPVEELAEVPLQALQEYFRSHPPEAERIAEFEKEIASHHWNANQARRPLAVRAVFLAESAGQLDRMGKFQEAIARYNEALALEKDYVPARQGLARATWRSGDAAAAATAAGDALGWDPESLPMWELLAKAFAAADRRAAAQRFERARGALPPRQPTTSELLDVEAMGLRVFAGDRAPEAIKNYTELISQQANRGTEAAQRRRMGWWLYRAGEAQKAGEELEAARQAFPSEPRTLLELGLALSDFGRQADAQAASNRLNGMAELRAEQWILNGLILWRTDERGRSKSLFEGAAQTDAVWLEPHWAANNFSPATAKILDELRLAELARRKEAQARAMRNAPSSPPSPRR